MSRSSSWLGGYCDECGRRPVDSSQETTRGLRKFQVHQSSTKESLRESVTIQADLSRTTGVVFIECVPSTMRRMRSAYRGRGPGKNTRVTNASSLSEELSIDARWRCAQRACPIENELRLKRNALCVKPDEVFPGNLLSTWKRHALATSRSTRRQAVVLLRKNGLPPTPSTGCTRKAFLTHTSFTCNNVDGPAEKHVGCTQLPLRSTTMFYLGEEVV